MDRKHIFSGILIMLLMTHASAQTLTVRQYIDSFKNIAMREMIEYKIPASITLAQGLLESGSGNSRLAKTGNNHFGIKCKKEWTGCTILEDDDALQECFRCYANPEDSYKDHSRFLKDNKRYAALFSMDITDYKSWAGGLLAAGYATNRKYAELLIGTIERNKLASFDTLVVSGYNPFEQRMPANIEIVDNKVPSTVLQPNQSIGNIAMANHKTEKRIAKYNDLSHHQHIEPGDVIYLRPKKRKASVSTHQVAEGENMWLISQKYAIKINSLYKKNLMETGTEPLPGEILHLQEKASSRPDTGRQRYFDPVVQKDTLTKPAYHIVSGGETLYGVSRIYHMTVDDLIAMNDLKSNQLFVGQRLKIRNPSVSPEKPGEKPTVKPVTTEVIRHAVKAGETLYSIARLYQVSVADIKSWNILNNDSLFIGQMLEIRKR
jgi:LysM repeat protein